MAEDGGAELAWEVVVPAGAEPGERPVWDHLRSCLLWVDIHAGRLHRYRPGEGSEVVLELAGLYVTTAWEGMGEAERAGQPLAGHLLRLRPGSRGQRAPAFAG